MLPRHRALSVVIGILKADPALRGGPIPDLSGVDWHAVLSLANGSLLAPSMLVALRRSLEPRRVPPEVRRYLTLLYRLNRRRNRVVRRQAVELIEALNEAGIEPILLKGVLCLFDDYPMDPAQRMMADIDVVVPAGQLQAAVAALHRIGYVLRDHYPDGHHAFGEFARTGAPAAVDLHTELIDQDYVLPAEEVQRDAFRTVLCEGAVCFLPSPTHRIFHHLLHAQIHHRGAFYRGLIDLRQLHEFAMLAADSRHPVNWQLIEDRMRRFRLAVPLHSYTHAARVVFGVHWPFAAAPPWRARLHVLRGWLVLLFPALRRISVTWGNLRSAFAWHRMEGLYRESRVPSGLRRLYHVHRILRRHPLSFPFRRLFRP
jgi:hypothetical protein